MKENARTAHVVFSLVLSMLALSASRGHAEDLWNVYDGFDGPGKGKEIVLVSGDEEYRSEEALSQLGKVLAKHHGFKCTVAPSLGMSPRCRGCSRISISRSAI